MLSPLCLSSNGAENWVSAGNLSACKGAGYTDGPVQTLLHGVGQGEVIIIL